MPGSSEPLPDTVNNPSTWTALREGVTRASFSDQERTLGVDPAAFQLISNRFERHEMLGRGGFGVVYRAYDRKLDRFIAVKVPHRGRFDDASGHKRVEREAAATARLRHRHIVTLYDFITCGDQSLLINELVEGETLAELVARFPRGYDLRLAAMLVQRIAQAVQHAHDQNVLHRDIKPSNILLDTRTSDGELPFCPRLTDFGVARIIRDDTATESHAQFVGTWHYTPPEVIEQSVVGHTRASDIYSLGVVLYELLTGGRPFAATTLVELFPKIRTGYFVSPRVVRPEVPRDLEAICLRCMARNPAHRYASAGDLAADLASFISGDPVVARLPGTTERVLRWTHRHPTRAAILSITALALIVVVLAISLMNRKLSQLNTKLQTSNQDLESAVAASRQTLFNYEQTIYASEMRKASIAIQESRLRDARTVLDAYGDGQPLAHHRDIEWHHGRFQISRGSATVWKENDPLYCIAQSSRYLAVAGAAGVVTLLDRDDEGSVRRWETGQIEINSIVIDPDGERLWCSGDDGSVHAYTVSTGERTHQIQAFTEGRAYELIHYPEPSRIVCISSESTIAVIDELTGEIHHHWTAKNSSSIAPVGPQQLAVGHAAGVIRIYDVQTGTVDRELKLQDQASVQVLAQDPSAARLWVMAGNSLRHLDLTTWAFSHPLSTTDEPIAMAYDSADDSFLVSMAGGVFQRLRVDGAGVLTPVEQWVNDGQRVFSIAVNSDTGEVLSVDSGGALRRWHSAPRSQTVYRDRGVKKTIPIAALPTADSEDWPELAIIHRSRLSLVDARDQHQKFIADTASSLGSINYITTHCLIVGSESFAQLIDLATGAASEIPVHGYAGIKRSRDGKWLCGADPLQSYAWILNADRLDDPICLSGHNAHAIAVAEQHDRVFWNDGNALMSRRITTADAPTPHAMFTRVPKYLELSEDQRLLAVGLTDREVHLWDWQHNRQVGPIMMHTGSLHDVAFSSEGRTLMTIDEAATLRFWNITTGQLMLEQSLLASPSQVLNQAKFSPDRRFVILQADTHNFITYRLY